MSEPTSPFEDLKIVQTRVYYDPGSGEIIHVHKLAVFATEAMSAEQIEEEMSVFEKSIERRHGRALASVDVEADAFDDARGGNVVFHIDLETGQIAPRDATAAQ